MHIVPVPLYLWTADNSCDTCVHLVYHSVYSNVLESRDLEDQLISECVNFVKTLTHILYWLIALASWFLVPVFSNYYIDYDYCISLVGKFFE